MDILTEFANNLTPEQYLKLIEFARGPIPQEIKDMTDDELLAELEA